MSTKTVIRWLLLVPSAVAAWYVAFFVSVVVHEVVVGRCLSSDTPAPPFCRAPWFPLEFLGDALVFLGVGFAAVLVVVVSAVVAPAHKRHVAWAALGVGAIAASVMAYGTGLVAAGAFAIASGSVAAVVVSRRTGPRHAVRPTNVVPSA